MYFTLSFIFFIFHVFYFEFQLLSCWVLIWTLISLLLIFNSEFYLFLLLELFIYFFKISYFILFLF